jgi:hypothetical protein
MEFTFLLLTNQRVIYKTYLKVSICINIATILVKYTLCILYTLTYIRKKIYFIIGALILRHRRG